MITSPSIFNKVSVATQTSNRCALILCAGDGSRWNNYLGLPKQLIEFNGESLLARSARLLRENGIDDIVCVTNDARLEILGVRAFSPNKFCYLVETILSTAPEWSARTIILLGDVFFTRRAMSKISSFAGEIAVFGRPWASEFMCCNHGELFAMSFSRTASYRIVEATQEVCELAYVGAKGNLWNLYHTLTGLPLNSTQAESRLLKIINDMTNDFDSPDDYVLRYQTYVAASVKV